VDKYRCKWCGYVYDPAKGEPARMTEPGTPFETLPADWCCPDCRAPLTDFERIDS
jgi:rubredoxin